MNERKQKINKSENNFSFNKKNMRVEISTFYQ